MQQLFINGTISVNSRTNTGKSILLLAVSYGNRQLTKWLLDNNISKIDEIDDFGQTVFHLAASNGQLESLKWIYEKFKFNVNQKTNGTEDAYNDTALILASSGGHLDVVKWLILHANANVSETNKNGINALDAAVYNKHICTVSFLLNVGAGIKARLDDSFFDTFNFKNLFIIGATRNKIPVRSLTSDNFIDAISTLDVLRCKLQDYHIPYISIIRNIVIEYLNLYPKNKELNQVKVILTSLVTLKARCLFFLADSRHGNNSTVFNIPQMYQEDYKQIKPDNLINPIRSCNLL